MAASAKAKSKHCIVITSHSHHSCDICSRIQPLVIELWLTKKEEEEKEEGELENEKKHTTHKRNQQSYNSFVANDLKQIQFCTRSAFFFRYFSPL